MAPRTLVAAPAVGRIVIDGRFDEPAWASAPVGSGLMQSRPRPGEAVTLRTEFRVLADDEAVYVAVRLWDPRASELAQPLGRRDDENASDWCFVELDTRLDRRSAYSLGTNPGGLQVDGVFSNDTDYDVSWNGVWESATSVDAEGWSVEMRIPFSQLAFNLTPGATTLTWGFNVYRNNPRTGEAGNWSPRLPDLAGVVSHFNLLTLPAPSKVHRLELAPYLLGGSQWGPTPPQQAWQKRGGLDARIGLTSEFSLTATLLPDFGQVEADPTQLNLSAFELFQTEKRPFFTEGLDAFQFDTSLPLVTRGDSFAEERPFYSRRLGRAPRGEVPLGTVELSRPAATGLLGAAKLAGRSSDGWRVGALLSATEEEVASLRVPEVGTAPIEPAALGVVTRVAKESSDGNASLGGLLTGLYRPSLGTLAPTFVRQSWVGGLDGRLRWAAQTWEVRAWALGSFVEGTAEAIGALAAAPNHFLNRADAPWLAVKPGAETLAGLSSEVRLSRVGGPLRGFLALRATTPRFEMNELGFQRNSDLVLLAGNWLYQAFPTSPWLRRWAVGSENAAVGWTLRGELRTAVVDLYGELDFTNFWDLKVAVQHEFESLSTQLLRGGPGVLLPPRESARVLAHTDTRRATGLTLEATLAVEPGSGSAASTVSPSGTLQLGNHLLLGLGVSWSDQSVGWQWVGGVGGPAWVARLRQRSLSLSLRADLAFTPRLILQLYAQPFITAGNARDYQQLVNGRALAPSARFLSSPPAQLEAQQVSFASPWSGTSVQTFQRPDFGQSVLTASVVLRWEYRPGSFLTAVYSHGGQRFAPGSARVEDQFAGLFGAGATSVDTVMLKVDFLLAL